MFTKNTEDIGRQGIHKCGLVFSELGFIFREQTIGDYGIDAIIEAREGDYLSGKLIAVQIKSGESYFSETNDNYVIFRGDDKHYNYWINYSLPVIIVLYSPSSGECIWECFNKQTAINCKSGWKIMIPRQQTLSTSKDKLQNLSNKQSEFERRWTSLVIAKKWMLETKKRGELILEVEEWINKTSGRGVFTLKAEEDDGTEQIFLKQHLLGFGSKNYELVIRELFPWADIEIDEDFYEENMEEDCYEKKDTTDREIAAALGIKGDDLLKFSDTPPKLYPYRNGAGEVDFYRLKLTLNQIGESFIQIDHFLKTGKFYLLDNFI